MKQKILTVAGLSACLALGSLAGCGQKEDTARIYYLNYKPESTDAWKEIAEIYEEKTGVEVRILTAASGSYEQTLKSE
ncbi:MAG: carbohydrate ABC transporter substrate-binding protein, partial [Lachnospiraceae bacterium]|nr:carbohydrate ABC transporter substrate-binding protein [Lachnospiraceae bacterium]